MPIVFEYEVCCKQYRVKDTFSGRVVNCKDCGSTITVPGGNDEVEDYFEKGEDNFTSSPNHVVGSLNDLPNSSGRKLKKKKKRKRRSKNNGGWVGLGLLLKVVGYLISVFGFLILLSIGKMDGRVLISLLFWTCVFAGWIYSSLEDNSKWVTGSAALTGSHMLMTVFAVFYQGDPGFLLDTLLAGICLALLLNIPGVLSVCATIFYYSFTLFELKSATEADRIKQQFMGTLGASHVFVLFGALFLYCGSRLIQKYKN